jgi:hypothetical protein
LYARGKTALLEVYRAGFDRVPGCHATLPFESSVARFVEPSMPQD